jgi:hypothetical protein
MQDTCFGDCGGETPGATYYVDGRALITCLQSSAHLVSPQLSCFNIVTITEATTLIAAQQPSEIYCRLTAKQNSQAKYM